MFCFIVFGCQYQCNRLPGKTRLRNDLLCVEWDVKPYTLTHLVLASHGQASSSVNDVGGGQGNELGGGTFMVYSQELRLPQHGSCHRELRPYADLMNWLKIVDNSSFVKLRTVMMHACARINVKSKVK